jgi:hypothetical protein
MHMALAQCRARNTRNQQITQKKSKIAPKHQIRLVKWKKFSVKTFNSKVVFPLQGKNIQQENERTASLLRKQN